MKVSLVFDAKPGGRAKITIDYYGITAVKDWRRGRFSGPRQAPVYIELWADDELVARKYEPPDSIEITEE